MKKTSTESEAEVTQKTVETNREDTNWKKEARESRFLIIIKSSELRKKQPFVLKERVVLCNFSGIVM